MPANSLHILPVSFAAESDAMPRTYPRRERKWGVDEQVQALAEKLNLRTEQKLRVKEIFQRRQRLAVEIGHNTSMSAVERFNAVQAVYDKSMIEVRSILDPDQARKFDEMRPKKKEDSRLQEKGSTY